MTMCPMAKENTSGRMETTMKVSGAKGTSMAKEKKLKLMAPTIMEVGSRESPRETVSAITLHRELPT